MTDSVVDRQQYHPFYSSDRCGWKATTVGEGLEHQCAQILGHTGSHIARGKLGDRLLRVIWTGPGETRPESTEKPQEGPVTEDERRRPALLIRHVEDILAQTTRATRVASLVEFIHGYTDAEVAESMRLAYNAMLAKAYWSDRTQTDVVSMVDLDAIMGQDEVDVEEVAERIPEPSIWGVVEADCVCRDGERVLWVRTPSGRWRVASTQGIVEAESRHPSDEHDWDALGGPVLVREGLS